jgi:SAM-dependent methyltransferase
MVERYASGTVPWDEPLPPPEVRELVATLAPGRALDLGCGYGRSAIYLASLGWDVDGIDFVEAAVQEARARAQREGARARFHRASVTDLSFLTGPYDLALDVGCLHSLDAAGCAAYRDELVRLVRPGGQYLLFTRLGEGGDGPRGVKEAYLLKLFLGPFQLRNSQHGWSKMPDGSGWESAWLTFGRVAPEKAG